MVLFLTPPAHTFLELLQLALFTAEPAFLFLEAHLQVSVQTPRRSDRREVFA
jgi:hypothetical protein